MRVNKSKVRQGHVRPDGLFGSAGAQTPGHMAFPGAGIKCQLLEEGGLGSAAHADGGVVLLDYESAEPRRSSM